MTSQLEKKLPGGFPTMTILAIFFSCTVGMERVTDATIVSGTVCTLVL